MNLQIRDIINIDRESFVVLFSDTDSALLEHRDSGRRQIRQTDELLPLWSVGRLHLCDDTGRRRDPDDLSESDEEIIQFRLPYAVRFAQGVFKLNPKALTLEIACQHQHRGSTPGVSTCYRWAALYRVYGRVGLRRKKRKR